MGDFRVIVAGCGGMARTWVEYALSRDDMVIVGLVDIVEDSAKAMAERYSLDVPTYRTIEQALSETEANVVFDVTIPESHRHVVTAALRAGCQVLGEKPMGASLDDAKAMLQASKETGNSFAVMQNRRYNKQIRAYRDIVQSGMVGQIGMINADFFLGPHFGGFRDAMEHPLILDMAIHTFDQARFITGANPISVYCHEFNPPGSWYQGAASAVAIFEFSDGSVFCYRGSWCAQGAPTSWEASWRITGSIGTALWDGQSEPYCEVMRGDETGFLRAAQRLQSSLAWEGRDGHQGCLDEMLASLVEHRKAETDCSDNIMSTAMVFAAIESARTGVKVPIVIQE